MGAITELRRAFAPPTIEQAQAALTKAEDAFDADPTEATTKVLNDARNAFANAELRDRKKREREQAEAARVAAEARAVDERRFAELASAIDEGRIRRELAAPAAERMASLMREIVSEAVALDEAIFVTRQKRDQAVALAGKLGIDPATLPVVPPTDTIFVPVIDAVSAVIVRNGPGSAFNWLPKP